MELLSTTWYFEFPFDYEIKLYNLLSYLRVVEDSFIKKCLSPHLLHLEKMENELLNFKTSYDKLIDGFNKKQYKYFENEPIIGLDNSDMLEIYGIVDLSIPQIKSKIDMGYKIYKTSPQLLY